MLLDSRRLESMISILLVASADGDRRGGGLVSFSRNTMADTCTLASGMAEL